MKPFEAGRATGYRLFFVLLMGFVGFIAEQAEAGSSPFVAVEAFGQQTMIISGDSTHAVNQFGFCIDGIGKKTMFLNPEIHGGYRKVDASNLFELGLGLRILPVKLVINLGGIKTRVMVSGIACYTMGESINDLNLIYSAGFLFGGWRREGLLVEYVGRTSLNPLNPGWTIRVGYLFR
jgi:hypothetical protein